MNGREGLREEEERRERGEVESERSKFKSYSLVLGNITFTADTDLCINQKPD